MGAAEDVKTLLTLFSDFPEGRRYAALECFLSSWEAIQKREGYPRSERLDRAREHIGTYCKGRHDMTRPESRAEVTAALAWDVVHDLPPGERPAPNSTAAG
jgi:hypothetical protein